MKKSTKHPQVYSLPEYEEAWWALADKVFNAYHMRDPVLRFFPRVISAHAGPHRYVKEGAASDVQLSKVEYEASRTVDLRAGGIEGNVAFLHEFAESYRRATASNTFAKLTEVTDVTGNTMEGEGRPFNVDMFLDMLERIEIRFRGEEELRVMLSPHPEISLDKCFVMDAGGAVFIFIHPDKAEKMRRREAWTEAQGRRYEEIVAGKRAEYDAQKRTRRLS